MMRKTNTGTRARIPAWLSDPDRVAPCLCGMPLLPGQVHIMAEGELGMKRWFHAQCWDIMADGDDEWDDEDYG